MDHPTADGRKTPTARRTPPRGATPIGSPRGRITPPSPFGGSPSCGGVRGGLVGLGGASLFSLSGHRSVDSETSSEVPPPLPPMAPTPDPLLTRPSNSPSTSTSNCPSTLPPPAPTPPPLPPVPPTPSPTPPLQASSMRSSLNISLFRGASPQRRALTPPHTPRGGGVSPRGGFSLGASPGGTSPRLQPLRCDSIDGAGGGAGGEGGCSGSGGCSGEGSSEVVQVAQVADELRFGDVLASLLKVLDETLGGDLEAISRDVLDEMLRATRRLYAQVPFFSVFSHMPHPVFPTCHTPMFSPHVTLPFSIHITGITFCIQISKRLGARRAAKARDTPAVTPAPPPTPPPNTPPNTPPNPPPQTRTSQAVTPSPN